VVTADHGVTFRVGEPRRKATRGNLDDIAFVPLIVKLPGQQKGRIEDAMAQTIDIAHVLGVSIPRQVDGRSLIGRELRADGEVVVMTDDGTQVEQRLSALRARRSEVLAKQVAVFGTGTFARVYGIGPDRDLVGRRVNSLPRRRSATTRVELSRRELFASVDLSTGLAPTFLEGKLIGATQDRGELAIAVDGTIAAVTWTFPMNSQIRFAAMVPEAALRPGRPAVDVFVVRGRGSGRSLEEIPNRDLSYALVASEGREAIRPTVGAAIPINGRAIKGTFTVARRSGSFEFTGWAANAATNRLPRSLIVFADGRQVFGSRLDGIRAHAVLGDRITKKNLGFAFALPPGLLPKPSTGSVRVFALDLGVASELRYRGSYPWPVD
jgi:hypothetical protein